MSELAPPYGTLQFQFLPEEVTWQRIGNFIPIAIAGRNNSKKHYTGGEDKISFTLDFNGMFEEDKEHCLQKITWLQGLAMADGYQGPARNVNLRWGQANPFRFKVWVVKSVTSRMSLFHENYGFNPMQAFIDVELELDPKENTRLSDVRMPGNLFRALTPQGLDRVTDYDQILPGNA